MGFMNGLYENTRILKKVIQIFYQQKIYEVVESSTLSHTNFMTNIIISTRYFLIILFISSSQVQEPVQQKRAFPLSTGLTSTDHNFLTNLRISSDTIQDVSLLIFFLFLNTTILILIFIEMYSFYTGVKDKLFDPAEIQISRIDSVQIIKKSLASLLKLYPYIFFFPSLFTTFVQIPSIMSIVNLVATFSFGILSKDLDYDYLLTSKNKLARQFSRNVNYIQLISELVMAFLIGILPSYYSLEYILLLSFFSLEIFHTYIRPYYKLQTQKWIIFIELYCFIETIIFKINDKSTLNSSIFVISSLVLIPLTFQLSEKIIDIFSDNLIGKLFSQTQSLTLSNLDFLMRSSSFELFNTFNSESYNVFKIQKKLSIIKNIFDFVQTDFNQIQDESYSLSITISEFQKSIQFLNDLQQSQSIQTDYSREEIQKMLNLGLRVLFERVLLRTKGDHSEDKIIPYLVFLMESLQQPKQFWVQYMSNFNEQLDGNHPLFSMKRRQILFSLKLSKFSPFNSEIFSLEFAEAIKFEKCLNKTETEMIDSLRLKLQFIFCLRNRIIDLQDLTSKLSSYFEKREKVKNYLNHLNQIHRDNARLKQLNYLFQETMAITGTDLICFIESSFQSRHKYDNNRKRKISRYSFSEESCVITAEFKDSFDLTIKQVSSNFFNIFPCEQQYIEGKQIDSILPNYLKQVHQKLVKNYIFTSDNDIEDDSIEDYQNKKFIFAGSQNSIILFPMWIKIKLNYFSDSQSFGMCAQLTNQNDQDNNNIYSDFILYDSNTKFVVGVSKQVSELIFVNLPNDYTQHQKMNTSQINIGSIFPLISAESNFYERSFEEENETHQEFYLGIQENLKSLQNSQPTCVLLIMRSFHQQGNIKSSIQSVQFTNNEEYSYYLFTVINKKYHVKYLDHLNLIQITKISQLDEITNRKMIITQLNQMWVLQSKLEQQNNLQQTHDYRKFNSASKYIPRIPTLLLQRLIKSLEKCYQPQQITNSLNQIEFQYSQKIIKLNDNLCSNLLKSNEIIGSLVDKPHNYQEVSFDNESHLHFNGVIQIKSTRSSKQNDQLNSSRSLVGYEYEIRKNDGNPTEIPSTNQNLSKFEGSYFNQGLDRLSNCIFPVSPDHQDRSSILKLMDTQENNDQIQGKYSSRFPNFSVTENKQQLRNNGTNITKQQSIIKTIPKTMFENPKIKMNFTQQKGQQIRHKNQNTILNSINSKLDAKCSQKKFQKQEFVQLFQRPKDLQYKQNPQKNEDNRSTSTSKKSSKNNVQQLFRQIMQDRNTPTLIKFSSIIGFALYIILLVMTIQQFYSLQSQILDSKENQKYSTWCVDFQASVNSLVKNSNLLQMLKYDDFQFPSEEIKNKLKLQSLQDLFDKNNIIINLIKESSSINSDQLVFQLLLDTPNLFSFGKYYGKDHLQGIPSLPQKYVFYTVPFKTSIHHSIIMSYQHTARYANRIGTGRSEYYMILNNLNFNEELQSIQDKLLTIQTENDQQLQLNLKIVMFTTICISAACLLVIVPLNAYVVKKCEEVLQLFATYSYSQVQDIVDDIRNSYLIIAKQLQSVNTIHFDNMISNEEIRKNSKNLSETTLLPKITRSLILLLLIIYFFIIIQPILNQFFTSTYLTNELIKLKTAINLYSLKGFLATIIGFNYNSMFMKLHPDDKPINLDIYMSQIQSLLDQSPKMQSIISTIIGEQDQFERFEQELYEDFFYEILKSDICDLFMKFPEYKENSKSLDSVNCGTVANGFLKKGFQVALNKFLLPFNQFNNLYKEKDNQGMIQFANGFFLEDFTHFEEYLELTLGSMKNFLYQVSDDNYNYIRTIYVALFIYQVAFLSLVFIVAWMIFSERLKKKLQKSKQFLQIIDIRYIQNNKYVISYINKATLA